MQCFVPLCLSTKHLGTYSKYFFENLKKKGVGSRWPTKKWAGCGLACFLFWSKIRVRAGLKLDCSGQVNNFLPVLPCLRDIKLIRIYHNLLHMRVCNKCVKV